MGIGVPPVEVREIEGGRWIAVRVARGRSRWRVYSREEAERMGYGPALRSVTTVQPTEPTDA